MTERTPLRALVTYCLFGSVENCEIEMHGDTEFAEDEARFYVQELGGIFLGFKVCRYFEVVR